MKVRVSDSFVGGLLDRFSLPRVSQALLLLTLALVWYEALAVQVGLHALASTGVQMACLLFAFLFARFSRIELTRAHLYLGGFLLVALLSGVLASFRGLDVRMITLGWGLLVVPVVALLTAQAATDRRHLLERTVLLAIPFLVAGVAQFVLQEQTSTLWVHISESGLTTRAFGYFGSPNVMGAISAIVALAGFGLVMDIPKKERRFARVALWTTVALALVATAFTFSRSAWFGLVVGLLVMAAIRNWRLLGLAPLAGLALLIPQVRNRIFAAASARYLSDSALDGRIWSANHGRAIFVQRWAIGTGPGTYGGELAMRYASPVYLQGPQDGYVALHYADNQWLQLLVQTGILGVLLFVLFLVNAVRLFLGSYRGSGSWTMLGIVGATAAFIVCGFFGNVIEFGAVAIPMGVLLGVGLSQENLA